MESAAKESIYTVDNIQLMADWMYYLFYVFWQSYMLTDITTSPIQHTSRSFQIVTSLLNDGFWHDMYFMSIVSFHMAYFRKAL